MVRSAGLESESAVVAAPLGDIDLTALGRALWRKKTLILGLTFLTAGLAFAAVNFVTPRYKSEARVLIETRENIFLRPDAEKTMDRGATVDQEAVTSQVQLILSRDLAREAIKKLNLGNRAEFDPVLAGPSLLRNLINLTGLTKSLTSMTPEERVLKSYFDRLSAFQVEKSRVIAVEFESEDPDLAASAANTIAETYLLFQQAAKQDQTRVAGAWLSREINRLSANVAQAEAKVEQYRGKTNLFIGNNNTSLSNQQLGDFNSQLAAARGQKADAESKARLIRDALKAGTRIEFSEIANSELMRRLTEQRVILAAQLAEQSSTLLDQHPRIKELRAQIADLERQMRNEADRLARSLEHDAKLASSKLDELTSAFDQLKRQAASTNEQDVQLRALERDAKSQRDLLESYLAKYREATARDSIGAAAPDARIISTATISNTPSWPKKVPTILVASLAMLVLSSAFVLTGELLRAMPQEQVILERGVPSLRTASPRRAQSPTGADLIATAEAMGSRRTETASDRVEELARGLSQAGEGGRRVTVVSAVPDVHTTPTAIALARRLAEEKRVVLVELAGGESNLSAIADASAPGLTQLVAGYASFGEIITRDRSSRVHLVLAGAPVLDSEPILASARLTIAIEALARSYDHVVLDAGAAGETALDRLATLAPRAVLLPAQDAAKTALARERLLSAGFATVELLAGTPSQTTRAA
jgi:succinoglycan biosynthesis transport protein ExoP